MKVELEKIIYKDNLPFSAKLCRIDRVFPHRHNTELEFIYCLKGSVSFVAADQKYTLHEGDLHSIDYWDIHYLYSDEDNLVLVFHLDLSRTPQWENLKDVFFACESLHCYPYQKQALNSIIDYILSLSYIHLSDKDAKSGLPPSEAFAPAIKDMTDTLLKYFNWFNYENQDEYMNQDLYNRFHRVLSYCLKHYDSKISISQLAAAEHINRNYFSQFISKTIFSTFSNMVNYIRCYEAESLLLTTEMANSEISYRCGFSDPKYFYSAFKTLWGITPTEHRESYGRYYSECLKSENSRVVLENSQAALMVRDYIAKWHIRKTLDL